MDILSNLQSLLGGAEGRNAAPPQSGAAAAGLGGLLTPEILGGLATAFLGGKAGGGGLGGGGGALGGLLSSLLAGGASGGGAGGGLMGALGGLMGGGAASAAPRAAQSSQADQAQRMIRTLVFAAKADGHIDANEQANINAQITKLGLGQEGRAMVDRAMADPLDPNLVARGVTDQNEAVTLYALSCAITNMDQFMERSYLDGLATALNIPPSVKSQIEARVGGR